MGVPEVQVVSPIAYLSTLAATCRSVVDSLPDAWKLRLHESPGDDILSALSAVQDMAKRVASQPSSLTELIPTDHHQLLLFTRHQLREKLIHAHDQIVQRKLKEKVQDFHNNGVSPYGDDTVGSSSAFHLPAFE